MSHNDPCEALLKFGGPCLGGTRKPGPCYLCATYSRKAQEGCGEICGYSIGKTSQIESNGVIEGERNKSNKKAGFGVF